MLITILTIWQELKQKNIFRIRNCNCNPFINLEGIFYLNDCPSSIQKYLLVSKLPKYEKIFLTVV
jgi:hypothetical protein